MIGIHTFGGFSALLLTRLAAGSASFRQEDHMSLATAPAEMPVSTRAMTNARLWALLRGSL